jgi:hypothetical protein
MTVFKDRPRSLLRVCSVFVRIDMAASVVVAATLLLYLRAH